MRKNRSMLYHIIVFVLAQLAWLSLLGLWIYWYVYNYLVFEKVGDRLSPQLSYDITNVVPFVIGLVLLVGLSLLTTWIFRNLNIQLSLNKLYDNFIGNITHELKSPLTSIQLYLETLKSRDVPPEKQKEFIDFMIKDGNRLQRLINSILEISALEQKKLTHNYLVYDAEPMIRHIFNGIVEQFRLPQETITITGKADCKIVADKLAVKIVLDNLIDNALKYSINSLKIDVKLNCNPKKLTIKISDNGIGIPQTERKKIFNKFYRVYRRDIPSVKGTGLGLYWVREIVKNHGGKISAISEGEGKGTTFTIEFPVYQTSRKSFANRLLKRAKKNKQTSLNEESNSN